MIEALRVKLGIVSAACNEVGINQKTHYNWLKTDAEYKDKAENIQDYVLDFAESALYKQVAQGNTTAIIFFLKTRGKKRGYIERPEIMYNAQTNNILKFENQDAIVQYMKELKAKDVQ